MSSATALHCLAQPPTITSTTAMAPPNLLTIPRELRDMIYPYLHHDIRVSWIEAAGPPGFDELISSCEVRVQQAPLLSVLLTNSQIHAEYMESEICKHIIATVRARQEKDHTVAAWQPQLNALRDARRRRGPPTIYYFSWPKSASHYVRAEKVLMRVHQVDIVFNFINDVLAHRWWQPFHTDLFDLVYALRLVGNVVSRLKTIRIAITWDKRYQDKRSILSQAMDYAAFVSKDFLPAPPPRMAHLQLVQRAEGLNINNEGGTPAGASNRTWVTRAGFKSGFCVYSHDESKESFWTKEEWNQEWKLQEKWRAWNRIPPKQRNITMEEIPDPSLPEGFAAWREKRGAKEAAAWFDDGE